MSSTAAAINLVQPRLTFIDIAPNTIMSRASGPSVMFRELAAR